MNPLDPSAPIDDHQVRLAYAVATSTPLTPQRDAQLAKFDAWLAAERQEQAAVALELAADECDKLAFGPGGRSVIKNYLHEMAARARGDQS